MNIQHLTYVLAVDTHRHFAKAAEKCFVTQPTLSMMIRKLEDELGVKIFDRSKQPVVPTEAGAAIIGANCGNGIADMIGIVKEIRKVNALIPILIHANAGMPQYCDGETTFPESPSDMAGRVKEIIHAGANIIGGCCGTTPDHICEVHQIVKSL